MATWSMNFFQNSNSFFLDNLISFHNMTFMFMLIIIVMTLYALSDLFINKYSNLFILQNHTLEVFWTIIPMGVLMFICTPSLNILYFIDESIVPCMTVKATGNQWYWSYEYPDFERIEFDSYMARVNGHINTFRTLDVDNRIIVPYGTIYRLVTTSSDVIHSWTIPCLGVKIDSVPGRLNQTIFCLMRPGLYYGQCSEICGANHSYMPICLEATSFLKFSEWVRGF